MASPFTNVLVPYDGSDPAQTSLGFGIALAASGGELTIVTVVDDTALLTQSSTAVAVWDPAPLLDALEDQAKVLTAHAVERAAAAGVAPKTDVIHEQPVEGILEAAEEQHCDLIVMGTHGRGGLSRMFMGSTTEGVVRAGTLPVLAVHSDAVAPASPPFRRALIALDDSDPADAAALLAAKLASALGTALIAFSAIDTRALYDKAGTYGYDPTPLAEELRTNARAVVERALERAKLSGAGVEVVLAEGTPVETIVENAASRGADLIVMGSHGRRGLNRLFLGSVAEHVLRTSHIPVLVVRA